MSRHVKNDTFGVRARAVVERYVTSDRGLPPILATWDRRLWVVVWMVIEQTSNMKWLFIPLAVQLATKTDQTNF